MKKLSRKAIKTRIAGAGFIFGAGLSLITDVPVGYAMFSGVVTAIVFLFCIDVEM